MNSKYHTVYRIFDFFCNKEYDVIHRYNEFHSTSYYNVFHRVKHDINSPSQRGYNRNFLVKYIKSYTDNKLDYERSYRPKTNSIKNYKKFRSKLILYKFFDLPIHLDKKYKLKFLYSHFSDHCNFLKYSEFEQYEKIIDDNGNIHEKYILNSYRILIKLINRLSYNSPLVNEFRYTWRMRTMLILHKMNVIL